MHALYDNRLIGEPSISPPRSDSRLISDIDRPTWLFPVFDQSGNAVPQSLLVRKEARMTPEFEPRFSQNGASNARSDARPEAHHRPSDIEFLQDQLEQIRQDLYLARQCISRVESGLHDVTSLADCMGLKEMKAEDRPE